MNDTSNYAVKHKVYVFVWTQEHTQTGKTTSQMGEISNNDSAKKLPINRHFCD
jgi:hypothetical protein